MVKATRPRGTTTIRTLGLGAGLLAGCMRIGAFPCDEDAQCVLDGRQGVCAEPGYCALPDDECDSGHRFHVRGVPEDLAGRCAPPLAATGSTGAGASTTGTSDGTAGDTSTGSGAASSSSDDGTSSTGSACGDHPCPCTMDLAVGSSYTCAARTDGDVSCWGANNRGQLGSGTTTPSAPGIEPVLLPGEAQASAIHAGNEHVCALASSQLLCWGRNNNDQIDPAADNVLPPHPMPLSWPLGAVGLGPEHSCVAEAGGPGLQCQGANAYSELGGSGMQPIGGTLPGMPTIDELAMGNDHSCARAGGRVWCWGRDQYGQLGQNMVEGPTATKVEVSLPNDAVALVAGSHHSCAVTVDMDVLCWGRNNEGQIGNGKTVNRQVPTLIDEPLPAAVVQIDATNDTTCALLTDGDLWCWGGMQSANLGIDIGGNTPLTVPKRVMRTDALPEPITGFGVGNRHLCAYSSSGRLWCWGFNQSWQVGPVDQLVVTEPLELDLGCPPQ